MDEIANLTRKDAFPESLGALAPCGHPTPCGCKGVGECCFKCPLPRCRYDGVGNGIVTLRNERRNAELVKLRAEGVPIADLVSGFQIGRRTVFHILQEAK